MFIVLLNSINVKQFFMFKFPVVLQAGTMDYIKLWKHTTVWDEDADMHFTYFA